MHILAYILKVTGVKLQYTCIYTSSENEILATQVMFSMFFVWKHRQGSVRGFSDASIQCSIVADVPQYFLPPLP